MNFLTTLIADALHTQQTGNSNSQTTVQNVIEADYYTLPELRWRLAVARRKKVPDRTLKFWLDELCISPNAAGLYTTEDLQVLIRLVNFLRRCRSIAKFKTLLLQEISNHAD